jgi:hypothetical protein
VGRPARLAQVRRQNYWGAAVNSRQQRSVIVTPLIVVALVASLGGGCASEVKVRDISGPPPQPGVEFEGIPVRFPSRQAVEVYALQPDGSYTLVHSHVYVLPDQSRMFAVRVDADELSDHTLALEVEADGTPKKIKTTTSSQGGEVLSQVGSSLSGVATAVATLEQKQQEVEAAERKKGSDDLANREKLYLEFRDTVEEALRQEAKVNGLPSTTPNADRFAEVSKLRILKLKANQAARRAGELKPFPDEETLPS